MPELNEMLERSRGARDGHVVQSLTAIASLVQDLERGNWYELRQSLSIVVDSVGNVREWSAVATQLGDVDAWCEPTVSVAPRAVDSSCIVETHPDFWDCECESNYIHPKTTVHCGACGSWADASPDSHVSEVDQLRWSEEADV